MRVAVSRRYVLVGAVVLVAVAVAVVGVVVGTGGDGGADAPLATPRYTADPVPKARVLDADDLPRRCGVSSATIDRYAPADSPDMDDGNCRWYSLNRGKKHCGFCPANRGDHERVLDINIDPGDGKAVNGASRAGDALRALNPAPVSLVESGHQGRTVGGLGDEALYFYTSAAMASGGLGGRGGKPGASLAFRTGAAVVTVNYRGRDWTGDGPVRRVTEKQAKPAVFAAAADVAHALHAPAKPSFTAPRTAGTPVRRVPHPCDLVPAKLADRLAEGAERKRGTPSTMVRTPADTPYGLATDTCRWDSLPTCCLHEDTDHRPERHLSVTVASVSEWRRGVAVPLATRQYLERHHDARDGGSARWFRALRGLGDQAFAAYVDDTSLSSDGPVGAVVFRYHNLVIETAYWGDDERPLPRDQAVTGAYTAAARARAALPG